MPNQSQDSKPLLYALALYASRMTRFNSGNVGICSYQVKTALIVKLAQTDAEAYQLGIDEAKKLWPETEGYANHHITLGSMPAEFLEMVAPFVRREPEFFDSVVKRVADRTSEDENEPEDDKNIWPNLIAD